MKINSRQSYDAIPIQNAETITTSVKNIDIGIIITLFLLNSVYS